MKVVAGDLKFKCIADIASILSDMKWIPYFISYYFLATLILLSNVE